MSILLVYLEVFKHFGIPLIIIDYSATLNLLFLQLFKHKTVNNDFLKTMKRKKRRIKTEGGRKSNIEGEGKNNKTVKVEHSKNNNRSTRYQLKFNSLANVDKYELFSGQ